MANAKHARLKLLLIAALCVAPVLASWLSYRLAWPSGGHSYGLLLPTQPFAASAQAHWPRGQWVLAATADAGCGQPCRQRFFAMRQIHVAQGEAASRLTRVALLQGGQPPLEVPHRLAAAGPLPAGGHGFYLIDPLGNQVLFYRDDADPRRVIQEVARVLKTNNGLG